MTNFFVTLHAGYSNLTHLSEHLMIIFAVFFAAWGFYSILLKPKKARNNKKF